MQQLREKIPPTALRVQAQQQVRNCITWTGMVCTMIVAYKPSCRRSSAVAAAAAAAGATHPPAFSISILPPPLSPGLYGVENIRPSSIPPRQPSPLASPWPRTPGQEVTGPLAGWPGFDTLGHSPTAPSTPQYAWSTDRSFLYSHLSACEEGCTQHAAAVHGVVKTLRAYYPGGQGLHPWGGGRWDSESSGWANNSPLPPSMSGDSNIPWGIFRHPPILEDADLFAVCRFKRLLLTNVVLVPFSVRCADCLWLFFQI